MEHLLGNDACDYYTGVASLFSHGHQALRCSFGFACNGFAEDLVAITKMWNVCPRQKSIMIAIDLSRLQRICKMTARILMTAQDLE